MVGFNTGLNSKRYLKVADARSRTQHMTISTEELMIGEIARLDPITIINLARDYCNGYTLQDISDLYGISFAATYRICKSSTYDLCCYR